MTETDLLPRRYNKEMDSFHKLADALGEPVENVYNMPERERSELMTLMQIDVTVAVTPVKHVRASSSHVTGRSLNQDGDGDQAESSSGLRKRKKSGGKRPFDYDSDDDFVPDESDRDKKFKFNYEEMEKDFLSVYDDGSKQSSSRRQPTRAAARKTNQRNKNLDNEDITRLLDNNGEDDDKLPNLAPLPDDLDFSRSTKEPSLEYPVKTQSLEQVSNVELKKDEQYAFLLKSINERSKKPLLIAHTRDPTKLLEEDLPMLNIGSLREWRTESGKKRTDMERRFSTHLSVIKGISEEGLISSQEESMSWIKMSSLRRKTIQVKWSKDEVKPTEFGCENMNLDEPLLSRVEKNLNGYKIPKNIDISPVPVSTPSSSSGWLSKPLPGASSNSQVSKLKLKKPTEKPKITLRHFYNEDKQEKPSSSRSDSEEIRKRRLSEKILEHLGETDDVSVQNNEDVDDEVEIVKEVASPYNASKKKDK